MIVIHLLAMLQTMNQLQDQYQVQLNRNRDHFVRGHTTQDILTTQDTKMIEKSASLHLLKDLLHSLKTSSNGTVK